MFKENSENPKFYRYFLENSTIVSICSAISGADIEILQVLSSNFAGFNIFTAPFSKQAEIYIFWCSLVGFCFCCFDECNHLPILFKKKKQKTLCAIAYVAFGTRRKRKNTRPTFLGVDSIFSQVPAGSKINIKARIIQWLFLSGNN